MAEKPPSLPDVWEENPIEVASPAKQKTVPVKMVELGPLGEYPQKTVLAALCGILGVLLLAAIIYKSRPQKPIVLGSSTRAIAVSADGSRLLVGLRDGSVRIVDAASGKALSSARLGSPILAVTFGSRDTALVLVNAGQTDPEDEKSYEPQPTLQIFSPDLATRVRRELQPNAHDVVWSETSGSAIVLAGGANDSHASLEFFPDRPLGIAASTPELIELPTYTSPQHLAVSADGSRVAVTFATSRRANLLIFDVPSRKIVSGIITPGIPDGVAINANATAVMVAADSGAISKVTGKVTQTLRVVADSSTWPTRMVVADADATKAYTSGALDVPEANFQQERISREAGLLPTEHHASSSIALSPDGKNLYVTFEDRNGIGVVDVPSMQWLREIELH
jgi:WD40 repeat protein